jgi:hypothetical protein
VAIARNPELFRTGRKVMKEGMSNAGKKEQRQADRRLTKEVQEAKRAGQDLNEAEGNVEKRTAPTRHSTSDQKTK